jgi:hypothetical protein
MRLTTPAVFLALLLIATPTLAAPKIFEALEGEWSAEGKAFGADAKSRMEWTPALDGKFFRVDYRIEMTRDGGAQVFEGVGHYQPQGESGARGFWADNSGDLHPITAIVSDDVIISHWGVAGGKQGRTEYRLKDGGVLVTDWILTPEGWKQFNQAAFKKAP